MFGSQFLPKNLFLVCFSVIQQQPQYPFAGPRWGSYASHHPIRRQMTSQRCLDLLAFFGSACVPRLLFFRGTLKLATFVAYYHWPKMSTTMYALQLQTHKRVYYAHSLFLGFFLCGWCFLPGQDVYSLDFPVRSVFRWSHGSTSKAWQRFQVYLYLKLYTNIETTCNYGFFHPGFIGFSCTLHLHPSHSCNGQLDQHASGPSAAETHPYQKGSFWMIES